MNDAILVELQQAVPEGERVALDLQIRRGITVLLGNDELQLERCLKMVAGVAPAAEGEVTLLGRPRLDEAYGGRELRRRIGYVTPKAPLLSVLDGMRNVMLPALYHSLGTELEVMSRAQQLLKEMACNAEQQLLPAYMSELQRRMLLVARALILEPVVLVLEQPLKGLESEARERLRDYLTRSVFTRVEALVIFSNDLLLASCADRIVFVGAKQHYVYAGWLALLASPDPAVHEFIERERRFCSVLQG